MKRRIFISSPRDIYLQQQGDNREGFKHAVIEKIEELNYEPQFYNPGVAAGGKGMGEGKIWDYNEVKNIISGCSGIVLIGFRYWSNCTEAGDSEKKPNVLVTEYCQYEGAIARTFHLPVFPLLEKGVRRRLMYSGGDEVFEFPENAGKAWLDNSTFQVFLNRWNKKVEDRYDLFLGYCSKIASTAREIKTYLEHTYPSIKILDWTEFKQSDSILNRIKEASDNCTAAILLFSADELFINSGAEEKDVNAVPRDNVLFEAGYFMNAKGTERVLIIEENSVKTLSDLEGIIKLPLQNRDDIVPLHEKLKSFIEENL